VLRQIHLLVCLALFAYLNLISLPQSPAQTTDDRADQANQKIRNPVRALSDHDLPSPEFLTDSDSIPFRPGFRMAAPKTAFRLTGGYRRYYLNSPIISECLCNLPFTKDMISPFFLRVSAEAKLYMKYTLSDSLSNTLNCNLKARSDRHLQRQWVNYLLGNFILGTGPENVLFPPETSASQAIKKSRLMRKTLREYMAGRKDTLFDPYPFRAHFGPVETILMTLHPTGIEHFTGSFEGAIQKTSDSTWRMTVINITSVTSGDLYSAFIKPSSWLKSFPRSKAPHPYGNIMQVFQLNFNEHELRKLARL